MLLAERAKSLKNANVFEKVFWEISFVLLFLTGFCGLFCHFQMTDFSPFLSWHIWTTYIELLLKFLLLCFTFPYWLLWSLLSFSDDGFFTFSLMAYMDDIHRTPFKISFALFYFSLLAFVVSFVIFRWRIFHLFSHGVYGRHT